MDSKLKNVVIACVVLVSLSIAIYFLYFLPKQSRLSNLIRCNEEGYKLYDRDISQHKEYNWFEPKFYFNTELNTCLYKGGYSYHSPAIDGSSGVTRSNFIRDVYANRYLGEWGFSGNDIFGQRDVYDNLDKKFFDSK